MRQSRRRDRATGVVWLSTAVRAYVPRTRPRGTRPTAGPSGLVLILDTETTTDRAQRLLFGSYRIHDADGRLRQEGLIAADDLPAADRAILEQYVVDHADDRGGNLRLLSRDAFMTDVFWPIAYKARAQVVGFNLPFDLSRLAIAWHPARHGGFSLVLFDGLERDGRRISHQYRPEISIKAYGPKRHFIRFTSPARIDRENLERGKPYPGRFVDCHTLAYALTDRSLSLAGAAREFGLSAGKAEVDGHGVVTPAYIDYNRQDVRLTYELYQVLTDELSRHPIDLAPEAAASPAAIAKGYLRTMGVQPPLDKATAVPERALAAAMVAYYGGRAECRIRLTPMPIRYVDYTSEYPTVFALLNLWPWVTARAFTTIDATDRARALLATATRGDLLDPAAWLALAGVFCRIRPAGDLVPVRATYGSLEGVRDGSAWTIGLNELESGTDRWYALADLLAGKILSGRTADILEAIAIEPERTRPKLRSIRLRSSIPVDPSKDLFRTAIEERQRVRRDPSIPAHERRRLEGFLKTLANGGAYGIWAEYHQLDPVGGEGAKVHAHGLWPLDCRVRTPEEPGEFCFPPMAASVTAGARLLLALLQAGVEARGGTYLACDTDSLLIVSSEAGGLLACTDGPFLLPGGVPAVQALSWAAVDEVLAEMNHLNPYDPTAVPSLIKLEAENFARDDPTQPMELFGLGISAKRYALYNRMPDGLVIRKPSNHGLGLYRSPMPPGDTGSGDWPAWVEFAWDRIIHTAEDLPIGPDPSWLDLPAVGQLPVSSPLALRAFEVLNANLPYAEQTKPFGFMLVGHVDPLAPLPAGLRVGEVIPVAPFATDPSAYIDLPWVSRRDGTKLAVTTKPGGERGKVRLRTYRDVLTEYGMHPEHKSGDPSGGPGVRGSRGLLPRLRVVADGLPVHIGKESNRLEEVDAGAVVDPDEIYVVYRDDRREFEAMLPALRWLRDERGWRFLAEASGLSERALRYALNGGKVPHREARARLLGAVVARRGRATQ